MNLTNFQLKIIKDKVNNSSLSLSMKEDLIDHFCCAIEAEIRKGMSFEKAYKLAYQNICPNGFDEIQNETIFLVTLKKEFILKRLMYISGYLSAIGISTCILIKIIDGPFILTLLVLSFILIFIFLPIYFINLSKHKINSSLNDKLKYFFGFSSIVLLILYINFKIAHWPGAFFLLISFAAVLNFALLPILLFKMYKKQI